MTTATRDELAVKISELKRQDWPRFSLEHIKLGEEGGRAGQALLSAAENPDHRAIIQGYLRHFVPGECPSCGYGMFGWGIAHGSGSCSCGWPGTVYHRILDDRELDNLVCTATCNGYDVCGRPRGEHVLHEWRGYTPTGDSVVSGTELRCPAPKPPPGVRLPFDSRYHPPVIADFTVLLWAHPYDVSLRR